MTIHLSLGCGDVSITRTIAGTHGELETQLAALLARLLALAQAAEEVPI